MTVERTPFFAFGMVSLFISGLVAALSPTPSPSLMAWFTNVLLLLGIACFGAGLLRSVLEERDDSS
jgi:hypothetical protein